MDDALFQPETRAAFRRCSISASPTPSAPATDEPRRYTFWDYQAGAWQKNHGIRIDHLLLSPQAADRLVTADRSPASRGWEKPSDHVPVIVELRSLGETL